MEIDEYLRSMREAYVERYRRAIRAKRAEGLECAVELWVQPNVPAGEQGPPHPLCIDILAGDGDKPQIFRVSSGDRVEGPLVASTKIGDARVSAYQASWDVLTVWMRHADPDWSMLDAWCVKWMDVNRSAVDDEDGLCGVVHYIGLPISEGGGFLHEVDFGSAPVEAATELLDVLVRMGATAIELGRSDGSDLPASVLAELRRKDLSPKELTTVVAGLLSQFEEVEDVQSARPLELAYRVSDSKHERRINLDNLNRLLQRTGVEARPLEVHRFLRGQWESMAPGEPQDLSQLRPAIKDDRFIRNVVEDTGMKKLLARRFVADLWIACVWDAPNGMRFATTNEAEPYGMSPDQFMARARENFLKNRPPVELSNHGPLWVAQTRDCYDATLLLDDNWVDEMSKEVSGELLACVPARHVVLIGGLSKARTLEEMRAAARRVEKSGDHLISGTILIRRGGAWHQFERESMAEEPGPGARPTGVPARATVQVPILKKRPWWKFWQ